MMMVINAVAQSAPVKKSVISFEYFKTLFAY